MWFKCRRVDSVAKVMDAYRARRSDAANKIFLLDGMVITRQSDLVYRDLLKDEADHLLFRMISSGATSPRRALTDATDASLNSLLASSDVPNVKSEKHDRADPYQQSSNDVQQEASNVQSPAGHTIQTIDTLVPSMKMMNSPIEHQPCTPKCQSRHSSLAVSPYKIGQDSTYQPSYSSPSPAVKKEFAIETADISTKPKFRLQKLMDKQPLPVLENGVKAGTLVLDLLRKLLSSSELTDAQEWIEQINRVQEQAVNSKTIVGVVGNTGAGKSSVINALLDEEQLVPTNCMRACTAVIIEISYNTEDVDYRAEIEFIEPEDWKSELKILFQELLDGNGSIYRETANEDTEAGVAYAKIKSVYPKMTKAMIEDSSPEKLMQEPIVSVLGSSKIIQERDPIVFYKKLQAVIDSKEKVDKSKPRDKSERPKPVEPALWPLIKIVRVYVKHPTLKSGVVLVDLPGVHDSNAARAKVAGEYMKTCTSLWIVAPINRAVDDKSAKTLLGETFKRQLKMDSAFNAVTFICSKTDDISVTEAQYSLGLDDEFEQYEVEYHTHMKEIKRLQAEQADYKSAKEELEDFVDKLNDEIEVWETMKDDTENGKSVFAPQSTHKKKRKKQSGSSGGIKKRRRSSCTGDESEASYDDNDADKDNGNYIDDDDDDISCETVTLEEIQTKITSMKASVKESRQQRVELTELMRGLKEQIKTAEAKVDAIDMEKRAKCIAGRNEYSLSAIQQDFAAGIREIDQEIAEEDDAANFNPEEDARDYDEVARSLPVFCVSSRAYQKLQGRFRQEADLPGFKTTDETQIPQLQEHCKGLTIKVRTSACNQFLAVLSQLLNSLLLWGSNDTSGPLLTEEQKAIQNQQLQGGLKQLESEFNKEVDEACEALATEFQDNVYDRFDQAITYSIDEAIQTVLKWNSPYVSGDREHSGFHWSTYKAICRRNGTFRDDWHNCNVRLTTPIVRHMAPGWERCFARRLPSVWQQFAKQTQTVLRNFHETVKGAQATGSSSAALTLLDQQQLVYEALLKQVSLKVVEEVNECQRDINRAFTPVILDAMTPAYELCTEDRGRGSFTRMKAVMNSHVSEVRHRMFRDSVHEVKTLLDELVEKTKSNALLAIDEVYQGIQRDYLSALRKGQRYGEVMSKKLWLLRKEVIEIVDGAGDIFEKVVRGEPFGEVVEMAKQEREQDERVVSDTEEPAGDSTEHQTAAMFEMMGNANGNLHTEPEGESFAEAGAMGRVYGHPSTCRGS